MDDPVVLSRIQFAFTVTYHICSPSSPGLAFLIAVLKTLAVTRGDEIYYRSVGFWSRIFAVSFVMGVVTGIPLEFQFGTNWARISAETGSISSSNRGPNDCQTVAVSNLDPCIFGF